MVGGAAAALALTLAVAPTANADGPGAQPVRGLDISSYQHRRMPIDWPLLARDGIRFVAVKVSEGTYYRNPYYSSDVQAAAAAGLAVLPYVFANPARAGGAPTARFAVGATGSLRGPARLPLVVDLENDPYRKRVNCYGLKVTAMIGWIAGFVGQARALTGKWPVIYTAADWWQECAGGTGQFSRDPLWLAAYDDTSPAVPSAWGHWTFWQYSNIGRLPGVGLADLDYYQPTSDLPALREG
jgi:GH25 family lysozyme M1 (1,4-beta-N-acetylmuramidase)